MGLFVLKENISEYTSTKAAWLVVFGSGILCNVIVTMAIRKNPNTQENSNLI